MAWRPPRRPGPRPAMRSSANAPASSTSCSRRSSTWSRCSRTQAPTRCSPRPATGSSNPSSRVSWATATSSASSSRAIPATESLPRLRRLTAPASAATKSPPTARWGYNSAVTASLPQEVREAFGSFITCEYTTIDSRQRPIVWPVTPYYENGGPCIDVTTGLGYPKKALDARRNPHVALLFSDLTGCGIDSGINVLVQGTADVDDRDLSANRERYWRESAEKLPATKEMHPPKLIRGLFDWYYTRIYVHVRPERVFVWPNGDVTSPPDVLDSHMDEVRSGHSEEPLEPHEPVAGGGLARDSRIEELDRRYETAVVAWVAPDGFPLSARAPVSLGRSARRISGGADPARLPLTAGPARV